MSSLHEKFSETFVYMVSAELYGYIKSGVSTVDDRKNWIKCPIKLRVKLYVE